MRQLSKTTFILDTTLFYNGVTILLLTKIILPLSFPHRTQGDNSYCHNNGTTIALCNQTSKCAALQEKNPSGYYFSWLSIIYIKENPTGATILRQPLLKNYQTKRLKDSHLQHLNWFGIFKLRNFGQINLCRWILPNP